MKTCIECGKPASGRIVGGRCSACYARELRRRHRHKQRICTCCRATFMTSRRDARYCGAACRQKARRQRANFTSTGNPAGRFPPEKHKVLDAVFAAAQPLPSEVEIPGEGKKSGAEALVWALGGLIHASRSILATTPSMRRRWRQNLLLCPRIPSTRRRRQNPLLCSRRQSFLLYLASLQGR